MLKAIVDNIQGGTARLLVGDDGVAVAVPVRELPRDVRPGAVVRLSFNLDEAATRAREQQAKREPLFVFDPE